MAWSQTHALSIHEVQQKALAEVTAKSMKTLMQEVHMKEVPVSVMAPDRGKKQRCADMSGKGVHKDEAGEETVMEALPKS